MAYSPTNINETYWRIFSERASKVLQKKMKRLDSLKEFRREDKFHDNEAPHHWMYKLETINKSNRGYEFLIEYDIHDPSLGIYYGCKGLIYDGDNDHEISIFHEEWEKIREELLFILNNVFPEKDFTHRFRMTDNANDRTYWPFWISLHEDEDIIEVAARATKIIRNVYERFLNGVEFVPHKNEKRVLRTRTAFTNDAYEALCNSLTLKNHEKESVQANREILDRFIKNAIEKGVLYVDPNYEKAYRFCRDSNTDFIRMMDWLFLYMVEQGTLSYRVMKDKDSKEEKRTGYVHWEHIANVFLNQDGEVFKSSIKAQMDKAKETDKKRIDNWQEKVKSLIEN